MIRCNKCGTLNEADATFCSQCDAFLEWSGEAIEESGQPARRPPAPPPPAAPSGAMPPVPPDAQPPAARPSAPAPAARPGSRTTTSQEPASRKPEKGAVTPERKAKASAPRKIEKPEPGQRACPTCGTGNDPDRKFCRRCGSAVGQAPVETAPPAEPRKQRGPSFLSRIFRRGKQEAYMAGQRPESMLSMGSRWRPGSSFMVFGLLGAVGLGGLASYYYMPGVSDAVDDVIRTIENRIGDRAEVNVVSARAQFEAGYPALNMIDGSSNTWWAGEVSRNGRWQLDFVLQEPSDLLQVNFDAGADGETYEQLGRPREIQIRADGELGPRFTLANTSDNQPVEIDLRGVEELRIIVYSHYVGSESDDVIAVREVSFVGPKG